MITKTFALSFAERWINAFNSGDINVIFDLYDDHFEMISPYIKERMHIKSCTLKGKSAVRPYWEKSLAQTPPLNFRLIGVYTGATSVIVNYESLGRKTVCELFEFNDDGKVIRGMSQHLVINFDLHC